RESWARDRARDLLAHAPVPPQPRLIGVLLLDHLLAPYRRETGSGAPRPLSARDRHYVPHSRDAQRRTTSARRATQSTYFFLPPTLPALPALRRITSSAYLMPLPLYGSGLRMERIVAATWPTSCLSMPETMTRLVPSTAKEMPCGGFTWTGC